MLRIKDLSSSFQIIQSDSLQFSSDLESRVDELWQAALSFYDSRLFNGQIFSAKQITQNEIIGTFVEYKYLMAQHLDPRLKPVLNIKPVSVLGLLTCPDGILFGKRQNWVATQPNEWGFLPSEYLGADTFSHDGKIDYVKAFLVALKNELNIEAHFLTDLQHSFLVEDKSLYEDHYSLVLQADIALSSFAIKKAHLEAPHDEYELIKAIPNEQVESFLNTQNGKNMTIAGYILGQKGYLTLESNCA